MKSQKGVTLLSLTVYIIVFTVVLGVMALMTRFFFSNIKEVGTDIDPLTEYTTFNSFFSDEVNHNNIKILECEDDYIVFDNSIQYTFVKENKGIYRNNVKICRNIQNCTFSRKIQNGTEIITVKIEAGNKERTTTYTLKN